MKNQAGENGFIIGEADKTVVILKLLAEKNRLKIIFILKNGEHCACEIIRYLGLPQNLVSHHLNRLRMADLIQGRKEGSWVHYSLTDKGRKAFEVVSQLNLN